MNQSLTVGISDYKYSKELDILVTYALGSCVGVCLYDKTTKVGGLSHIMLPDSKKFDTKDINRMKFADTAIRDLVKELDNLCLGRSRFIAKIAGGAQMFEVQPGSKIGGIGERNIVSVKKVLNELRIPIISEDIGLNYGRTQYFDLATGIMKIKATNRGIKDY
jgi:chemotaxis protein CheD